MGRHLRTAAPALVLLLLLALALGSGWKDRPVDLTVPGKPPDAPARIVGEVRSVFGDPLEGALVQVDGFGAITDHSGRFAIDIPTAGPVQFRAGAGGYKTVLRNLNLEPGANDVRIGHETGLWPAGFAVDFHTFYRSGTPGAPLFALVALANGGADEVFILDLTLTDPLGQVVRDFLESPEDFRNLAGSYGDANYAERPRPVVILRPQALCKLELVRLDPPVQDGDYLLEVEVALSRWAFLRGLSRRCQARARAVPDADFDPHSP